jgi:hypothetical protein
VVFRGERVARTNKEPANQSQRVKQLRSRVLPIENERAGRNLKSDVGMLRGRTQMKRADSVDRPDRDTEQPTRYLPKGSIAAKKMPWAWNYFRGVFNRRWTKSTPQMENMNVGRPMVSGTGAEAIWETVV